MSLIPGLLFSVSVLTRSQVIGEVGSRLNYDELVVYDNHAIRLWYLAMYNITYQSWKIPIERSG